MKPLRVVLIKPSKYAPDGTVERFRRGFMPNSTLPYLASMTPLHRPEFPLLGQLCLVLEAFFAAQSFVYTLLSVWSTMPSAGRSSCAPIPT